MAARSSPGIWEKRSIDLRNSTFSTVESIGRAASLSERTAVSSASGNGSRGGGDQHGRVTAHQGRVVLQARFHVRRGEQR